MLLIFAISAAVFIGIAVAILLDRTSYTRLILHSIAVWIVMVLQLYALFMVNIHRRASDQVQSLSRPLWDRRKCPDIGN